MEAEARIDRQIGLERRNGERRQRRADDEAKGDPGRGHDHDLDQIGAEDQLRRRAEAFEGGDGRGLAVEIALDRVADADAADQKSAETDEGEEQAEPLDKARDTGDRVLDRTKTPAGIGKGRRQLRRPPVHIHAPGKPDLVMVVDQAARLHQAGGAQPLLADDHARAELEHAGPPVGLAHQHGADDELGGAQAHPVAKRQPEADEEIAFRHRAEGAHRRGKGGLERHRRGQDHFPEQGIGPIDGLDFHQRRPARLFPHRVRHRPHPGDGGNGAVCRQIVELGVGRRAVHEPEIDVAAKQGPGVPRDPFLDRRRERTDGGDGPDAERQAGEHHLEAPEPSAQLAARQSQRQRPR